MRKSTEVRNARKDSLINLANDCYARQRQSGSFFGDDQRARALVTRTGNTLYKIASLKRTQCLRRHHRIQTGMVGDFLLRRSMTWFPRGTRWCKKMQGS